MYVIGLTGGIASGKTTAAQTLRSLGAQVLDADAIARRLTSPGGGAAQAVLDTFGTLDRKELAAIVFRDENARQVLNAIVHPMVQAEMEAEMLASSAPIIVLDIPLLYESHMEHMADEVWVVYTSREEQIHRLAVRDGLTQAQAIARIDSQMPTEEKLALADAAIDTSGPVPETRAQIERLWRQAMVKTGTNIVPFPGAAAPARPVQTNPPARRAPSRRTQHQQVAQPAPPPPPMYASPPPRTPSRMPPGTRPIRPAANASPQRRQAQPPSNAWEDTSTLMDIPTRSFFSRQPPAFWAAAGVLLVGLMIVMGIIGINAIRSDAANRAEERRLAEIAEEKARYKFLYKDIIEQNAVERQIHPAFIAAVIYNESRFNPEAVSNVGARGLMQIMEETGEWIAGKLGEEASYSFDNLFVPETNIRYGVWYLSFLSQTFGGDIVKVTAGYHAGQNAVARWLEMPEYSMDGKRLDVIPYPDTELYVQRVVNTYEIYKKHYYPDPTQPPA